MRSISIIYAVECICSVIQSLIFFKLLCWLLLKHCFFLVNRYFLVCVKLNFHLDIKSYSYITAVITSKTNKSKEKNKEMNSKIVTVKDVLESAEEYGKDGV